MSVGDPQAELILSTFSNDPAPAGEGLTGQAKDTPPKPPDPEVIKVAPDKWSDELAKQIVIHDYERANLWRRQNKDMRWNEDERLLNANLIQRIWEGTNIPRSSLGIKVIWQQIESLMPHLMSAIFTSSDGIWFDCYPRPGTDPNQAMMTRELLSAQLDEADVWEVTRRVLKSSAIYGTGVMKVAWKREERDRQIWDDKLEPKLLTLPTGQKIANGTKRTFKRKDVKWQLNRPDLTYVSLKDFYIDPSHKLPTIEGAGYVIQRSFMTLEELTWLAEKDESIKLPPRQELIDSIKIKATPVKADADQFKQRAASEADIRENYPRQGSSDPARAKFEILEYWTEDRLVTMLNRRDVIRNIPNPYLFLPFVSVNYCDVLDQFYGVGIAEIVEGEQKLQQGLLNAHIDETSLNIHGALVVEAGTVLNKQQLRRRPGQIIEATRADAVQPLTMPNVTQDAFIAIQQSQARAQQYTGISDMISSGVPSVKTSATRTAAGVGAVVQASSSRVEYMVENVEQNLIVPMLDKVLMLNQRYLDPKQAIGILGPNGHKLINPLHITNGEFMFELRAASRMSARQNAAQSLPFLLQTIMNPAFMELLSQQGKKVNIDAVVRDVMGILNWRSKNDWFVPMTPQDQQMQQQEQQQQQQMAAQKQEYQSQRDIQRIVANTLSQMAQSVFNKALDGQPAAAMALGRALDGAQAHMVPGAEFQQD